MLVAARKDLEVAASKAAVDVRACFSRTDFDNVRLLMEKIWGPGVLVPANVLRGLVLAGTPPLLAERSGDPVGFALGFAGSAGGLHFHSHQVGVVGAERGKGVGLVLKLAQRAACLEQDVSEMRWTFDPLLRANARFNLLRLGAQVRAFIPDCYGERSDAFNTGDRTDRLEVTWSLSEPLREPDVVGSHGAELVVDLVTLPRRSDAPAEAGALIAIPVDYLATRSNDLPCANAWRCAVGQALSDMAEANLTVTALAPGGYVIGEVDA